MSIKFLKINERLNFVSQNISFIQNKSIVSSIHNVFVIDCSGSMWDELSKIRKDMYNKISTILKPSDSVTIIWFSGNGQHGVLLEDYHVDSLLSLNKVRESIEKLTAQYLTSFVGPILEIKKVIENVKERNPNMLHNLFFLTDGYDNCSSNSEIIESINEIKEELSSATIIEYGWYCNKSLLNEMATAIGGSHIFSKNFDEFEPYIRKAFENSETSKRAYVNIDHTPHNGVVFTIDGEDVISYLPNEKNEIFVSTNESVEIFYITEETPVGEMLGEDEYIKSSYLSGDTSDSIFSGLYGAAFTYSRNSDYSTVSDILKTLGDSFLINKKANTFGTQKINELEQNFKDAISESNLRFREGYNPDLEPSEDAFCVLDMLDLLASSDDNKWYPRHESFKYKRTTGKAVAKSNISEDDKNALKELIDKGDIKSFSNKISEIESNTPGAIEFKYLEEMPSSTFNSLTWNEKRANLSVMVEYRGSISLPDNEFVFLPKIINTNIFRNYTIIKDGIIHSYELPVSLCESTFNTLVENGLLENESYGYGKIYTLDFSSLPVINRKMVKSLSAEDLFEKTYELIKLKASNTVFTQYKKRYLDGLISSKGFADSYGNEAAEWLGGLGIKDYGFSPPSNIEKMEEEIEVATLDIKIKGMSAPTKANFENAEKKLANDSSISGKDALMIPAIKEFKAFEKTLESLDDEIKTKLIKEWIQAKSEVFKREKSTLMSQISKSKFLTIVGKTWFIEFASREENDMILSLDDTDFKCTVVDKLVKIKI